MALWSIEAEDISYYLPDSTANTKYPPIQIFPFIQRYAERSVVVSAADYVSGCSLSAFAQMKEGEGHFALKQSDGREEA